jgi:hypothetical protein
MHTNVKGLLNKIVFFLQSGLGIALMVWILSKVNSQDLIKYMGHRSFLWVAPIYCV